MKRYHYLCLLILIPLLVSCSSTEKSADTNSIVKTSSLMSHVPPDSWSVMILKADSEAYQKLLKSPWGKLPGVSFGENGGVASLIEDLKNVGFEIEQHALFGELFSEALFFASALQSDDGSEVSNDSQRVVILESKTDRLPNFFNSLEKLLALKGVSTVPKSSNGFEQSMVFASERYNKGRETFLGRAGKKLFLSESESAATQSLHRVSEVSPQIVDKARKAGLFVEGDNADDTFGYWALDSGRYSELLDSNTEPSPLNHFDSLRVGFNPKGLAVLSIAMKDSPVTDLRYKPDSFAKAKEFSRSLSTSASISSLLSQFQRKPLLFLDIDSSVIKKLIGKAEAVKQAYDLGNLSSLISASERLAFSVVGKSSERSFFPLPDASMLVKTSSPKELGKALENTLDPSKTKHQMSALLQWQDQTIAGSIKARVLQTPIGLSVYLATAGDQLLLSTSKAMLRSSVAEKKTSSEAFSGSNLKSFSRKGSLANIIVDFNQMGVLLEEVGGTLQMFAPQQNSQELLKKENIDALKKLGKMVTEIRYDAPLFTLKSYYQ